MSLASKTCPKCGFVQAGGEECGRCGVVFRKAHVAPAEPAVPPPPPPSVLRPPPVVVPSDAARPSLRWVSILVVLVALGWLARDRPWARSGPRRSTGAALVATGWQEGASGWEKADEERRRTGRGMVVYFHTSWCGWCKKLDSEYLAVPEVRAYLDGTPRVSIDPERGSAEAELARRYGVNGYPTFLVVPARGGQAVRVHPFRTNGQLRPSQFVEACRAAE